MHIEELNAIVDRHLPQATLIPIARRTRWLEMLRHAESQDLAFGIQPRTEWHVLRAAGFGSSEVGGIVKDFRGESTWFGGARDAVAAKLMFSAPDPSTPDTRRGTLMEPMIRQMFLDQLVRGGANVVLRSDIARAMTAPAENGPIWERANPDEILEIDGRLFLADYKAPRPDVLDEYRRLGETNFDYAAQLHHISNRAARNGIQFYGRLLVSFDYNNYTVDIAEVEYDKALAADIVEAGNVLWHDFVAKGLLPEFPEKFTSFDIGQLPGKLREALHELSERYVLMSQIAKTYEGVAENTKLKMISLMSEVRMGDGGKLKLPGTTFTSKIFPDYDRMRGHLRSCGHDTMADDVVNGCNDEIVSRAIEMLTQNNIPLQAYTNEKHSLRVSMARTGDHFDFIESCRGMAEAMAVQPIENAPHFEISEQPKRTRKPMRPA